MQIPEGDGSFDAAFAIEATVHAPDKTALFREIFRVLRPGACFASYEWCLTEDFASGNAEHQRIKNDIMVGDALPDIAGTAEVLTALQTAGFELLDAHDRAPESDPQTPWYQRVAGPRPQPVEHPAHAVRPCPDQFDIAGRREIAGVSRGLPRGQHAAECGGGRAGRRRQVRHLYADVLLPRPQAPAPGRLTEAASAARRAAGFNRSRRRRS